MSTLQNAYHGKITSAEAKERLLWKPDGSFLVRDSTTTHGAYVLCLKYCNVFQYRILKNDEDKFYVEKGPDKITLWAYDSLTALLKDYLKRGFQNGLAYCLKYPVTCYDEKNEEPISQSYDEVFGCKEIGFDDLTKGTVVKYPVRAGEMLENIIKKVSVDGLQNLLCKGMDVNQKDQQGFTGGYYATLHDYGSKLQLILQYGADTDVRNGPREDTFVHVACKEGHAYCLHLLIKFGAKVDCRNKHGWTPLHYAATKGQLPCIEILLEETNVDINAINDRHDTPLHLAAVRGHRTCVFLLLSFGASMDLKNRLNMTALELNITFENRNCEDLFKTEIEKRRHFDEEGLPKDIRNMDDKSADRLRKLMKNGWFRSYDARYMIVGEFGVGKTSLAKLLVGETIILVRQSTDGIELYVGKAFCNVDDETWSCDNEDITLEDVTYHRMLTQAEPPQEVTSTPKPYDETKVLVYKGTLYGISNPDQGSGSESDEESDEETYSVSSGFPSFEQTQMSPWMLEKIGVDKDNQYKFLREEVSIGERVEITVTKQKLLKETVKACKRMLHRLNKAPIFIWDFGGQDVFNATHQTFLTYRGIYIIVIDGSRQFDEPSLQNTSLPARYGASTNKRYVSFWVNTILTYCRSGEIGYPKIIIIASHRDKVPIYELEDRRNDLFEGMKELFRHTSMEKHIIVDDSLFYDITNLSTEELQYIRQHLIRLAVSQPHWGERMPKRFLHLEVELFSEARKHTNIISFKDIQTINAANPIKPLSNEDLQLFLHIQHSLGKLLYFPVPLLKDFVLLSPVFLIDAFRSIITDQGFCKEDQTRMTIWQNMAEYGILKKTDVDVIWSTPEFAKFKPHKHFLVVLMEYLDFIVEPRMYEQGKLKECDFYLVPCMISKSGSELFWPEQSIDGRCIGISFFFKRNFLPPGIAFRFLCCCMGIWKLANTNGSRNVASGIARFTVDSSHDLVIQCEDDRIIAFLIHKTSKYMIMQDLAKSIQEDLTDILNKICEIYQVSCQKDPRIGEEKNLFTLELCCCNFPSLCFIAVEKCKSLTNEWVCPNHQCSLNTNLMLYWISAKDDTVDSCGANCTGIENEDFLKQHPSEEQLCYLSDQFTLEELREISLHLGLTACELEDLAYNHRMAESIKLAYLLKWKEKQCGFFKDLVVALTSTEKDVHILCKVTRRRIHNLDINPSVLERIPTDEDLDKISPYITYKSLQVAIYLGLSVADWENLTYEHPKNLVKLNRAVLEMWRQNSRAKPTFKTLANALVCAKKSPAFLFRDEDYDSSYKIDALNDENIRPVFVYSLICLLCVILIISALAYSRI